MFDLIKTGFSVDVFGRLLCKISDWVTRSHCALLEMNMETLLTYKKIKM
jgi:hypothetical protein